MFTTHAAKKFYNSSSFVFILITFIPFLVYLASICPTIYWRDSPEFVDVAYTLGISHPAGSPAYSIISKIFTFLPLFSISFKINLISLFFALLTIFFTCKVIQILLYLHYPSIKRAEANLIMILSSLFLTIMPSFWLKAIVAEVYTMNAFFLVLILYIYLKWSHSGDSRYLFLAAFLYGISLGVHAGAILFFPGFLLFFLLVQFNSQYRRHGTPNEHKESLNQYPLKSFTLILFFFILGFSIYLYLPVRSITNPEFDWGNPETLSNFYSHISDKKDSASHFENISELSDLLKDSVAFSKMAIGEITLIGFPLFIIGMVINFRKDKKIFLLLFLTAFINMLFYITSTFGAYKNTILFIPSFIIFIIWISLGICFIRIKQIIRFSGINLRRISAPIVMAFILFSFLINYKTVEKSNYYFTEEIIKEMYLDIDPNSILFSTQHWFAYRYFQDVENLRPDLIIILTSDMKNPDVFNPVTKLRYPMVQFPEIASTKESFYDFWPQLVKANFKERKMFADLDSAILDIDTTLILPYKKFLMRIVDRGKNKGSMRIKETYLKELKKSMEKDISRFSFFLDQKEGIATYYGIYLLNFSNYLRLRGNFRMAISFLDLAKSLAFEKRKDLSEMKAICLAELGRYDESISILKGLLNEYQEDTLILTNLGNLYLKIKDYKMSKQYLKRALSTSPNTPKAHFILGLVYSAEGRTNDSITEIKKAISLTKNPLKRKKMENYLKKIL